MNVQDDYTAFVFAVISAWVFIFGAFTFLFLKAFSVVVVGVFFLNPKDEDAKSEAKKNVLLGLDLLSEWWAITLDVFLKGFSYFVTIFLYFVTFLVISVILYIMYKHSPSTLGVLTEEWNNSVGLFWTTFVMQFLEILQLIFEYLVGVYNFVVFLFLWLPTTTLLHMLGAGMPDIVLFSGKIGDFGSALGSSLDRYFGKLQLDSTGLRFNDPESYEGFVDSYCPHPITGEYDAACFSYEKSEIDFYTPLAHLSDAVYHVLNFIPRKCRVLNQPLILLLHPFTDKEIAKALHYFLNLWKQSTDVVRIAIRRCEASNARIPLCFPDLGPWFNTFSYMLSHIGKAFDNWLDVAHYLILTIADPTQVSKCDSLRGSWAFNATNNAFLFGSNRTIITRLTPTLFAKTDGYHIEYVHHGRRPYSGIGMWPVGINTTYGVAAVSYSRDMSRDSTASGARTTTALLGCTCTDDVAQGLNVTCAIVPYDVYENIAPEAFIVPLAWEVANTPRRMACRDTKISVESIRYDNRRYSSVDEFRFAPTLQRPVSCLATGDCVTLDAAIWVMPVCPMLRERGSSQPLGQNQMGGNTACLRGLVDFSCFPFCVGVRRTNSANEPLFMRAASTWEDTVLLSNRDCVHETLPERDLGAHDGSSIQSEQDAIGTIVFTDFNVERVSNVKMNVPAQESTGRCRFNPRAISSIRDLRESLVNSSRFFFNQHQYTSGWNFANVKPDTLYRFNPTDAMLVEQQPFVFAGDVALRTVTVCNNNELWGATGDLIAQASDCRTVVDVMQIVSDEFNQFQMKHVVETGIGTTRRPNVQGRTQEVLRPGMLTLPPVVVRSVFLHNPATATRDAVWYGVNPDYETVHCMLRYCLDASNLVNCLQMEIRSNYDELRVWKTVPNAGCVMHSETGLPSCPPQTAQSVTIRDGEFSTLSWLYDSESGAFGTDVTEFCNEDRMRNFFIDDLESFDEMNVLVTVRRGNAQGLYKMLWGVEALEIQTTPRLETVSYFVHADTLEVSKYPWTSAPRVAESSGYLCQEMRLMPRLGSTVAEIANGGLFLFRTLISALTAIPAMIEMFENVDRICDLEQKSLGFYAYQDCGTRIFDLGEMFDSVQRANVYFWEILDFIAQTVSRTVDSEATQALSTFLGGARIFQENKVLLSKSAITGSTIDFLNTNQDKLVLGYSGGTSVSAFGTVTSIGSPAFMSGMSVGQSALGIAEYTWRLITRIGYTGIVIVKKSQKTGVPVGRQVLYVFGNMSNIAYESFSTDLEELILTRNRRMCTGVSLMMGYSNTWSRFLRHWCLAGVETTKAMATVVGSLLVEIPFVVCLCVDSRRYNFQTHVSETCMPRTAPKLKQVLSAMLAWNTDTQKTAKVESAEFMQSTCAGVSGYLESKLLNAWGDWALEHTYAAAQVQEILDYVLTLVGRDSNNCLEYQTNAAVSTILPQPLDYFQACGGTPLCRVKCASEFAQLRAALNDGGAQDLKIRDLLLEMDVQTSLLEQESQLKFRDETLRMFVFSEIDSGADMCACASLKSNCVGMIGATYAEISQAVERLTVRSYCIPDDVDEKAYVSSEWYIDDDRFEHLDIAVHELLDLDTAGLIARMLFTPPYGDHVLLLVRQYPVSVSQTDSTLADDRLVVVRNSDAVPGKIIASSASIVYQETCLNAIQNSIPPRLRDPVDDNEEPVSMQAFLKRGQIQDFVVVPSQNVTLSIFLKLDVFFVYFDDDGPPVEATQTVYVNLQWCEFLPAGFEGKRRTTPSACQQLREDRVMCRLVAPESGVLLFDELLGQVHVGQWAWAAWGVGLS